MTNAVFPAPPPVLSIVKILLICSLFRIENCSCRHKRSFMTTTEVRKKHIHRGLDARMLPRFCDTPAVAKRSSAFPWNCIAPFRLQVTSKASLWSWKHRLSPSKLHWSLVAAARLCSCSTVSCDSAVVQCKGFCHCKQMDGRTVIGLFKKLCHD